MPCAASDCSMPTWIAPKLPPPANTKAVLVALAVSDADTASSPAASWVRAALGEFIAAGVEGRLATKPSMSSRRRPGPTTTNERCCAGAVGPACSTIVDCGYGSRIALAEPVIGRAFARPVGSLVRDDNG